MEGDGKPTISSPLSFTESLLGLGPECGGQIIYFSASRVLPG